MPDNYKYGEFKMTPEEEEKIIKEAKEAGKSPEEALKKARARAERATVNLQAERFLKETEEKMNPKEGE